MGQPTPGGIGLQPAASPLKHDAHFFHDVILLPIIKGAFVGLQWAKRMHGFGQGGEDRPNEP